MWALENHQSSASQLEWWLFKVEEGWESNIRFSFWSSVFHWRKQIGNNWVDRKVSVRKLINDLSEKKWWQLGSQVETSKNEFYDALIIKYSEFGDGIFKCWGRGKCQGHRLSLNTEFAVALRICRWKCHSSHCSRRRSIIRREILVICMIIIGLLSRAWGPILFIHGYWILCCFPAQRELSFHISAPLFKSLNTCMLIPLLLISHPPGS